MSNKPVDFFTPENARAYDERNSNLSPISQNLHFLIQLISENLPSNSKVLSVGAGTGAEVFSLAKAYPNWTFLAVEPSHSMLEIFKQKAKEAGIIERCEFFNGYIDDLEVSYNFDAALSVLVGHFIGKSDRVKYYKSMCDRLNKGGYLFNAEISYDLESKEFPSMLNCWKSVQKKMGATAESLDSLPRQLKEALTVLPPDEVEKYLRQAGLSSPILFFQSFMISAWFGVKG